MKKAVISGGRIRPLMTVDSARSAIFNFDAGGNVASEIKISGASFEAWLLGDGNILYCHLGPDFHGVRKISPDGAVISSCRSDSEIFSCQPLPGGYYLAGELNNKRIAVFSPSGKLEAAVPVKSAVSGHEVMRSARRLRGGDYLAVHPGDRAIRRYNASGELLWEARTRPDTFGAVETPGGNIIYTAKTAVAELDAEGREVWAFEASSAPELGIHWLTGLHLLSCGNIAVCNWLGHGMEGTGAPLFEINRKGEVIWSLRAPDFTSDPANLQILDEAPEAVCRGVMK